MPANLFEVEHSTDIQNSLLKFVELQDFYLGFYIVANEARKKEFRSKLSLEAFRPINKRVMFLNYDDVAKMHEKTSELISVESRLKL